MFLSYLWWGPFGSSITILARSQVSVLTNSHQGLLHHCWALTQLLWREQWKTRLSHRLIHSRSSKRRSGKCGPVWRVFQCSRQLRSLGEEGFRSCPLWLACWPQKWSDLSSVWSTIILTSVTNNKGFPLFCHQYSPIWNPDKSCPYLWASAHSLQITYAKATPTHFHVKMWS